MTMIEGFTSTSSFLQGPSMTMIEEFTSTSSFLQGTLHDRDRRIYIYLFLFTVDPP